MTGIIYILKQANDRSVKEGQTTVSAESRLKSYSRDYELKNFEIHKEYEVHESALDEVERLAHNNLRNFLISGIKGAKEIFACSAREAEIAVEKAISRSKRAKAAEEKLKRLKENWKRSSQKKEYDNIETDLRPFQIRKIELSRSIKEAEKDEYYNKNDGPIFTLFWVALFLAFALFYIPYIGPVLSILIGVGFLYFSLTFGSVKKEKEELEEIVVKIDELTRKKEKIRQKFFSLN